MQAAMGFVGNYAPSGLSPQMYDMPVIQMKGLYRSVAIQPLELGRLDRD